MHDLRDWIARVDEIGALSRVTGADAATEVGGLVDMYQQSAGNPSLLFDRLAGYSTGHRLVANVLTPYPGLAITLGLSPECGPRELVDIWRTRCKDREPRPAVIVERGTVLENQRQGERVDATEFPAPVWHEQDGGPYIGTGCLVIMRDPDTGWVNSGTYRVQLHDAQTLGLYISPGKHGRLIGDKYWARGQARPVAISFGHDPLLLLLGGLEVDYGKNEFDVAGAIRGEPLEVVSGPCTGLPVPAAAEIVFEGLIPPDELRAEGAFGEWAGYYAGGQKDEPIVRLSSVSYGDDPIVLGCVPGKPPNDNTFFRSRLRAALIWDELERAGVPGITRVWSHEAGGGRLFNIVSIRQMYPGHSRQVGLASASRHAGAYANRYVVGVDEDIDPTDTDEVLWAMCTRTDVIQDIDVIKRCWSTSLDPMAYAGEDGRSFYNNRMLIDACRPSDRLKTFPTMVRTSETAAQRLRRRFPDLFGLDGKVRSQPTHIQAPGVQPE